MNRSYQLALVVAGLLVFAVLGYYLFPPGETGSGSGQPPTPPGSAAQNPTPPAPPAPAVERPAPAADPAAMARIADSLRNTGSSAADTGIPTLTLGVPMGVGTPAPGSALPGAPTTMPAGTVGGATPPSLAAYDASKALGLDQTSAPAPAPGMGSPAPATGSTTGTPGAGTPVMPLDPLSDPARAAEAVRALGTGVAVAPGSAKTYTVKAGDSFSSIAKALYGSERHWVAISQVNPMVDPNRLQVNQVLKLPEIAPEALRPRTDTTALTAPTTQPTINADGSTTYVVKPGDTLYTIAQKHYGKGEMWKTIYEANRAAVGANPERVKAGTKLILPVGPVRTPRTAHPSPDAGETTTVETILDEQK